MSPEERLTVLRESPPNTWIALAENESRLAAKGSTYAEAVANAAEEGVDDPVMIRIPDEWSPIGTRL